MRKSLFVVCVIGLGVAFLMRAPDVTFDKHAGDCNELASALDGLVDANKSALEQLANERASMTPEQRMLADQRVERAAGPELDRFRKRLRSGVMRCPTHERLHAALAKLAELGQPS